MKIKLDNENVIKFKSEPLYLGRKKIDKEISKMNLEILSDFLNSVEIPFILGYGTLLGAIREKDFITHDEDIDICLLKQYFYKFLTEYKEFSKTGFRIVRYDPRGFLSVMRDNEYIDMYFFSEVDSKCSECCGEFMLTKYLTETTEIDFLQHKYLIPTQYEEFLQMQYGENWNVPIEYTQSKEKQIIQIVKYYMKFVLPQGIQRRIYNRKSDINYQLFLKKIK